jgi:hypothetical protein
MLLGDLDIGIDIAKQNTTSDSWKAASADYASLTKFEKLMK